MKHASVLPPNNLNAVRLLLAASVLVSHAFALSLGSPPPDQGPWGNLLINQGGYAVNLFFFLSGFLITASWFRSPSMSVYFAKRLLRIYPAYIVAMLFTGAVIWVACPEFRASAGHGLSWGASLMDDMIHLGLESLNWKHVFKGNPLAGQANGSLWTIPIEFTCYLYIAALGIFGLLSRRGLILAIFGAAWACHALHMVKNGEALQHSSRFAAHFFAGVSAWLFLGALPARHWAGVTCLAGWLGICLRDALQNHFVWSYLTCPLGGYGILWVSRFGHGRLLEWIRKNDLSYGFYLYAFPVQQVMAMPESWRSPGLNMLLSAPVTLLLAWLSWNFVEKPFLKKRPGPAAPLPGAAVERTPQS